MSMLQIHLLSNLQIHLLPVQASGRNSEKSVP